MLLETKTSRKNRKTSLEIYEPDEVRELVRITEISIEAGLSFKGQTR